MVTNPASVPYWRLSSFYFFYFALLGAWLPYWPLYLKESGFDAQQIGYLAGILMATKIIAPNVLGWITGSIGRRITVIRGSCFIAFVIFLAIFLDQSFYSMALVIVGFSFFWNAVLSQFEVATLSHLEGRFQRYSLIRVWGSVGFIIAVAGLGWFFDFFPLQTLPYFVAALLFGLWVSSLSVEEKDSALQVSVGHSLLHVVRQPTVLLFLLVCFLLQLSHGPYYTFFSVYLEEHGYSRTTNGLLWSLGVFAEVLVFVVMHRLLQRFSLRQIMLVSLLLSAVRWLLIGYYVDSIEVLIFAQLLHAASFGSFHAYAVEMVRQLFSGGHEGQGMALYGSLSFGAGGAIGAVLSGMMWASNASLTFVLAALVCVIALVISLYIQHDKYVLSN
jgi:PPP family 3-phenylpropionic acid transporter